MNLYRKEVIQFQQERFRGDAVILPSMPIRLICGVIFSLVAAALWYLSTQQFRHFSRATGWLEPSEGVFLVYPEVQGGRISELFVHDGEKVAKGQPLARLEKGTALSSGDSVHDAMVSQYESQIALLEQQQQNIDIREQTSRETLLNEISKLKNDIERQHQLISIIEQRRELAKKEKRKLASLTQAKLLPAIDSVNATNTLLSLEQETLESDSQLAFFKASLRGKQQELQVHSISFSNEKHAFRQQISQLHNQLYQLHAQNFHIVTAPKEGVIRDVQVHRGEFIPLQQPLLSIESESRLLLGKMLIPASDIGHISEGQTVRIKYDAFPFQQFGSYSATVIRIAENTLLPEEHKRAQTLLSEPAYRVEIALTEQSVLSYGQPRPLRSGLSFSADIVTRQSKLWEWLFAPLLTLKGAW